MIHDLLLVLWFFLPAGLANVTPILVAPLPGLRAWDAPLDGGHTFRGVRILGTHKTWRGLLLGTLVAVFTLWWQQYAVAHYQWAHSIAEPLNYAAFPTVLMGVLFGVGALGGDALKSFFKRQFGIAPGRSWFPFDQLDHIIGAVLLTLPFVRLSLRQYVLLVLAWLMIHLISSYVGYVTHFKEQPL